MSLRLTSLAGAAAILAADRATKLWIEARLPEGDSWTVIPGLFNIVHTRNPGMAFSLLSDASPSTRAWLLVGGASLILAVVAWLAWRESHSLRRWALTLVFGGAAGNLYDRLTRGEVTDFLDFYLGSAHWPAFNVADSAITVGALILVGEAIFDRRPHPPGAH